ncbi:MAG: hypothetical protein CSH37_02375 [Thalassolituus sp.]|nr:glucosaminidase domain-containing protein [Pseudomonadota bacterium]TNC86974.1 MAG: hypothetical protein CSH37_02375 [Thalassolituus sp.]
MQRPMQSVRSVVLILISMSILWIQGCSKQPDLITDFEADKSVVKATLPDFSRYTNTKEKKAEFFAFMERLTHEANREIMVERNALKAIKEFGEYDKMTPENAAFLARLAKKYRLDDITPTAKQVERLLVRVAPVAPSLAMAQAANESAWGTSRFAKKGNNLFGQWCFSKGCGIVPESRAEDASHEVAAFKTPYQSVRSYMLNINRHDAYRQLRRIRAEAMQKQGFASGTALAGGLESYSERGQEYIDEVRSMIRFNKLGRFDHPEPVGS